MNYNGFVLDSISSSEFTNDEIDQINNFIRYINECCEENLSEINISDVNKLKPNTLLDQFMNFTNDDNTMYDAYKTSINTNAKIYDEILKYDDKIINFFNKIIRQGFITSNFTTCYINCGFSLMLKLCQESKPKNYSKVDINKIRSLIKENFTFGTDFKTNIPYEVIIQKYITTNGFIQTTINELVKQYNSETRRKKQNPIIIDNLKHNIEELNKIDIRDDVDLNSLDSNQYKLQNKMFNSILEYVISLLMEIDISNFLVNYYEFGILTNILLLIICPEIIEYKDSEFIELIYHQLDDANESIKRFSVLPFVTKNIKLNINENKPRDFLTLYFDVYIYLIIHLIKGFTKIDFLVSQTLQPINNNRVIYFIEANDLTHSRIYFKTGNDYYIFDDLFLYLRESLLLTREMNNENDLIHKYEYEFRKKITKIDDKIIMFIKTKWITTPYHFRFDSAENFLKFQDLSTKEIYSEFEDYLYNEIPIDEQQQFISEYKPKINNVLNLKLSNPKYYGRVLYGSKEPQGSNGSETPLSVHSIFNNPLLWFILLIIVVLVVIIYIVYRHENKTSVSNV